MNRPSIYQKKLVHQSFWMFTLNEMRMKTMFSFRTHMNHSLCTSKVKNINFFFLFLIFLILITRNANGNNIYAIHESFMIQSWRRLNSSSNQSITFVIRCFIQSLSLSLKYISKKLSSHPSCSLSFSSYPSSYPTTILSLFFIISFTINLAPKMYPSNYQFALQRNRLVHGMANFSAEVHSSKK